MSDKEEQNGVVVVEEEQEQESKKTMADSEEKPQKSQQDDEINKKFQKMGISFSIWPPTQRTRDAVINRLIETLSTPSVLSKRYGSMNADEASSTARVIEEEAFSAATSASGDNGSSTTAEDDGIEILQIYSKEISKRMLEAVKAKAATASENENPVSAAPAATSEETSSVES
ncbi:WPP domain [Macleaya cordata]|uniref:WPP domain n=1 Tax=Macleaya cordata TaxID=56857 RepID=A0A200PV19_MACCD|nr:WPP domain [Macleaya cordata]